MKAIALAAMLLVAPAAALAGEGNGNGDAAPSVSVNTNPGPNLGCAQLPDETACKTVVESFCGAVNGERTCDWRNDPRFIRER